MVDTGTVGRAIPNKQVYDRIRAEKTGATYCGTCKNGLSVCCSYMLAMRSSQKRGCASVILKKHHKIDGQISDFSIGGDFSCVGEDKSLFDVVVLILDKGVQGTVYRVVLAGFDFNGNGGKTVIIINQIVYLTNISMKHKS